MSVARKMLCNPFAVIASKPYVCPIHPSSKFGDGYIRSTCDCLQPGASLVLSLLVKVRTCLFCVGPEGRLPNPLVQYARSQDPTAERDVALLLLFLFASAF